MSFKIAITKKLSDFTLDINLASNQGIVALLGDSGSGKSMTLKSIAGIIKPDKGEIVINGKQVFHSEKKINIPSRERKVGYLFQNYALFPTMTVLDNILIVMPKKNPNKAMELLDSFKIQNLHHRYPRQLSGGQQQRVALARMMAIDPQMILLDEPFSALDTNLKWSVENDLREFLTTYDKSAIIVTHNKDEAYRLSDKVSILKEGKVEEYDHKYRVFHQPKSLASAKILGFKNYSKVQRKSPNKLHLTDYDLTIELYDKIKHSKYIAFDSNLFHLKKGIDDVEIPLELDSLVEDTENIILIGKRNQNLMTIEFPKALYTYDQLSNNFLSKDISVYYPKGELLQLVK
ncbi:MAG: ATP-binding cassette domain-containing protein [Tissierellia bacterium]|nr:ATP-binding cassette domain-containing protein [Tissierellia bacterium]